MRGFQQIKTAPLNREVEVRVGKKWFPAILVPDGSMDSEEQSCDQWQATTDAFPKDWCDGCCWESNSDGNISAQPEAWREKRP